MLLGLRNLQRGRNVEIKPYGVIGGQNTAEEGSDFLRDAGVDMKIGLTSSLTLDLTYNTDFAHRTATPGRYRRCTAAQYAAR